MKPSPLHALALLSIAALTLACTSDPHTGHDAGLHSSPFPVCDAIIKACHPVDIGEGPVHDCHDVGHAAANDADCIPKKEDCLRICADAADGGLYEDASAAEAGDAGDAARSDGATDASGQ